MTKGLYLHIPFCERKCNYCDFYSIALTEETKQKYVDKLCEEIEKWGRLNTCPIDTIYFGGGTPSLLAPSQLNSIMQSVRSSFEVIRDSEITVEINPGDSLSFIEAAAICGINRISVGIQSANNAELEILGRRHTFEDAQNTINAIKKTGIHNVSADIMIGLPDSTLDTLKCSIDAILSLETSHISSYILKVEKNTPFYKLGIKLPEDDSVADQYLYMSELFQKAGFEHYEISNFAKPGFQSRHNNKYWLCEEYIGIGPSAHSFYNQKRFYYPHSIDNFINGVETVFDCNGGDREEYIMLALRLSRGLIFSEFETRYNECVPARLIERANKLNDLCMVDKKSIRLTDQGMLVSNNIITYLLEVLQ